MLRRPYSPVDAPPAPSSQPPLPQGPPPNIITKTTDGKADSVEEGEEEEEDDDDVGGGGGGIEYFEVATEEEETFGGETTDKGEYEDDAYEAGPWSTHTRFVSFKLEVLNELRAG